MRSIQWVKKQCISTLYWASGSCGRFNF